MAYVYRHVRLDKNEVFYIGIGENKQRAYNKSRRNKIWKDIIKKTEYKVEILYEDVSWQEACEKEKELIRQYGKIIDGTGSLANMTSGGDGGDTTKTKICIYKADKEKRIFKQELEVFEKDGWTRGFSKVHKKQSSIAKTGKKYTKEVNKKKGRPGSKHKQSTIDKMKAAKLGMKLPIIECPHCGKQGGLNPMKQWHFNNCKKLKKYLTE